MWWRPILSKYQIITFHNFFYRRKVLLTRMSAINFFVNFDTIAIYTKNLVTAYHKMVVDIMTFTDILFVELSTFSSEISHFFPLPYRRSFCRMTERSRLKSFSSYKNRFLVIRMLLSKLVLREPCRFLFCFEFLHSSGVFKCLNCLRFLFFLILSLLMTD